MILSSFGSLVLARKVRRSKYPEGRGWRYFATMASTAGLDNILWLTACSIWVCGDSSSFGAFARAIASFWTLSTRSVTSSSLSEARNALGAVNSGAIPGSRSSLASRYIAATRCEQKKAWRLFGEIFPISFEGRKESTPPVQYSRCSIHSARAAALLAITSRFGISWRNRPERVADLGLRDNINILCNCKCLNRLHSFWLHIIFSIKNRDIKTIY